MMCAANSPVSLGRQLTKAKVMRKEVRKMWLTRKGWPERKRLRRRKPRRQGYCRLSEKKANKDPQVQKMRWLKGCADLISKCNSKVTQASTAEFPNEMHIKYKEGFVESAKAIAEVRAWLEKPRSNGALAQKLKGANSLVSDTNKDIKTFDNLARTYG